ncbi:MAG TPA: proline--tRNA ligase [Ktedonobacterales bacterium]|nr:proline--tRNA ligase [Ktedonobacterales bacterium]
MRMTRMMLKTQKHVTTEAELPSHQLILRAGLARRLAAGIYSLSPLAYRAIRRIQDIVREEMERIGGQELLLPLVQPAELWREAERLDAIGDELALFHDRGGHAMVLAMTHEESVTDLVRSVIESYRQLPQMVFQLQTKFRDEPRPRAGLVRLREFLMKDAYSFHATQDDFDTYYEVVVEAYLAIFSRLHLPVLVVEADTGMMGGKAAHEFMLLADGGEDSLLVCPNGDYAANQEIAVAANERSERVEEPLVDVYTPGATTIAALCEATGCAPAQTLKSVFYAAGETLVMALVRGDLDVNEVKLRNVLGKDVRPLAAEEARERGLVAGYAGPVSLHVSGPVVLVADDTVVEAGSLIAGANRASYHLRGATYGRDFNADRVGDIALVTPGMPCVRCGTALEQRRGIEAGNTFKLGTRYSVAMGATYLDEAGDLKPMIMGCYGLGITRALACVIEQHHDEDGIVWPVSVAPYAHHLVLVGGDPAAVEAAERVYVALGEETTLFDDRDVSAGIKLKDADLLGMPLRITVSGRSLKAGGAELRVRRTGETRIVPLEEVVTAASAMLAATDKS